MMSLQRICIGAILAWGILGSAGTLLAQLSWTRQTTSVLRQLKDVRFFNAQNGIAVGDSGTILRTIDGGTWSMIQAATSGTLWGVSPLPGTGGTTWLAGGDDGVILRSTDGGTTWGSIPSGLAPGSFIFGVHAVDAATAFVAGGNISTFSGVILKSTDAGLTWQSTHIPGTTFMDKVSFVGPMIGYAAGNDVTGESPVGRIVKTTDGGGTWNEVYWVDNTLTTIKAISAEVAIALGSAGWIYRTTDGGTTWNNSVPAQNDLFAIDFADQMNGIIVGYQIQLTTSDGGVSWTTTSIDDYLNGVQYVPGSSTIYAVGFEGTVLKGTAAAGVDVVASGDEASLTIDPATGVARLRGAEKYRGDALVCTLYDLLGRRVGRVDVNGEDGSFRLPEMSPGLQMYTVTGASGTVLLSGRLMIR